MLGRHLISKHWQKLGKRLRRRKAAALLLAYGVWFGMKQLYFSRLQVLKCCGSAWAVARAIGVRWFCVWTCAGLCRLQLLPLSRLCEEEVVAGVGRTE